MRLYRAIGSPVCGVLVVVALAAPAPAHEPAQANPIPVEQWADSACGTLSDWDLTTQSEVVDAQSTLKKARRLKGTAQVKKVKQVMLKLLDKTLAESMTVESDLRGAGDPAVANGSDVERTLSDGFHDEIVTFFDSSRTKVNAVSTKDGAKALRKLLSVENQIPGQTEEVSTLLHDAIVFDTSHTVESALSSNTNCDVFQPLF